MDQVSRVTRSQGRLSLANRQSLQLARTTHLSRDGMPLDVTYPNMINIPPDLLPPGVTQSGLFVTITGEAGVLFDDPEWNEKFYNLVNVLWGDRPAPEHLFLEGKICDKFDPGDSGSVYYDSDEMYLALGG